MIQFGNGYCEILHDGEHDGFVEQVITFAKKHKEKQRRKPLEINLIVKNRNSDGLEIKAMEIKRTKLDLDLFYEDEFKTIDETIKKRLKNSERQRHRTAAWITRHRKNNIPALPDWQDKKACIVLVTKCCLQPDGSRIH